MFKMWNHLGLCKDKNKEDKKKTINIFGRQNNNLNYDKVAW